MSFIDFLRLKRKFQLNSGLFVKIEKQRQTEGKEHRSFLARVAKKAGLTGNVKIQLPHIFLFSMQSFLSEVVFRKIKFVFAHYNQQYYLKLKTTAVQ